MRQHSWLRVVRPGVLLSSRSGRIARGGQRLDAQLASLRAWLRVLLPASDVADALPVVALNDNDRMVVKDDGSVNHLGWNDGRWWGLNIKPNR